ncbi:MAG: type III-B CRISPR module RAMP protein Cmr1 [Deltaproteobacteria bacterium]|nr:MAG: type III-B CRISPR module RAMP protein Cmr1 [Deltaproteobacteria bacterium]
MRKLATTPPALSLPDVAPGRWTTTFTVQTLTPIYKGGANPKGIDRDRPFRESSLRGQLRTWWRATSPLTDVAALRTAERKLWGGVFGDQVQASDVRVGFSQQHSRPARQVPGTRYVLWPHNPDKEDALAFHAEGATARLRVEASNNVRGEVERALSAWLLLGGLGGRTRRGLGRVWHEGFSPLPRFFGSTDDWLRQLCELAPPAATRDWPSLGGARVVVGPVKNDALAAWKHAIDMMQSVRMSGFNGQSPPLRGVPRPAALRSDFPQIVQGQRFTSARAALGLPIQFRTPRQPGRDSFHATLNIVHGNRFPSPVLFALVPLRSRYAPAFVALSTPYPREIQAKNKANRTPGTLDPRGVDLFMDAAATGWDTTVHSLGGTP